MHNYSEHRKMVGHIIGRLCVTVDGILNARMFQRLCSLATYFHTIYKVISALLKAAKLKWDWVGHVCRMSDEILAKRTNKWVPVNVKQHLGRPRRWRTSLTPTEDIGSYWQRQHKLISILNNNTMIAKLNKSLNRMEFACI